MENGQNFNSYSYVLNNPLKYTDKNGEFWGLALALGAVCGAYIGGSVANHNANPLKWNWSSAETYLGIVFGSAIGAATGAAFSGMGLDFVFSVSTPFITVGIEVASNKNSSLKMIDYGYTTVAGGGYSNGIKKAEENADKAYDNTLSTAQDIVSTINNDLSNLPITSMDVISNTNDFLEEELDNWTTDVFYGTDFKFYANRMSAPKGVTLLSAKSTYNAVGNTFWGIDYLVMYTDIYHIWKSNKSQYNKNIEYGQEIGGFVGAAIGSRLGILTAPITGYWSIGIAMTLGAFGTNIGTNAGGGCVQLVYLLPYLKPMYEINNTINELIESKQPYLNSYYHFPH